MSDSDPEVLQRLERVVTLLRLVPVREVGLVARHDCNSSENLHSGAFFVGEAAQEASSVGNGQASDSSHLSPS